MLCCIGPSVLHQRLCFTITAHDNIAVATGLMLLGFRGVALSGIEFRALNLGRESLKVGIDDKWGWELFLVILEGELVFPLLRHLQLDCSLSNLSALESVGFQKVLSYITMKTALAEVLALPMLALAEEQSVEILDPGVMKSTSLVSHFERPCRKPSRERE